MKTNLDKLFKNNGDMEKDGIWFNISEETGFKIKRFGGSNDVSVKAAMAKHYKPYARLVENGTLGSDKEKEIMVKVFVNSCLTDWRGVVIDDKPADYSPEVAIEFFKSLPELADTLIAQATDGKNYREDLGNS